MQRSGILSVGNFIVDIVKMIDLWPTQESLANILRQYQSNGGGAYNLLKNLAAMQAGFPLEAGGLVGDDHWGQWIREDCNRHEIDVRQLYQTTDADTSFTDVMTIEKGGRRTFFHYRGTNALLDSSHIDLNRSQAKILHLAYLLLLDRMDLLDRKGDTHAARLLEKASALGFMTSIDLVSVHDPVFKMVVRAALPYTDVLFLNDFEAERITGIRVAEDDRVSLRQAEAACRRLLSDGVRKWVFLHFPDGAVAMGADGMTIHHGSVRLPTSLIAGAVGAGDAFAAGVLMGLHKEWPMSETMKLGICAAASCLLHPTCSNGILPAIDCIRLGERYGFRSF
jgi:sugar/nucleoside kinase (ribokinase family)